MSCMSAAIAVGALLLTANAGWSVLLPPLMITGSAMALPVVASPECLTEPRSRASVAVPRLLLEKCVLPSLMACRRAVTSCRACPGDADRFGRLAMLGWLSALVVLTASNRIAPWQLYPAPQAKREVLSRAD